MIVWIYKNLIVKVIAYLTGQSIDLDVLVPYVLDAETRGNTGTGEKTGKLKAIWVAEEFMKILPTVATWIINLLVEIAVAYAKKQGWIK